MTAIVRTTLQKQSPPSHVGRDVRVSLSPDERGRLLAWSRSRTLAARVVLRSRILLMLADGLGVKATAERLRVAPSTVRLWRRRFSDLGLNGLLVDAPGRGRKPALPASVRAAIRNGSRPSDGNVVSVREQARALGVSASTVSRWRRRGG